MTNRSSQFSRISRLQWRFSNRISNHRAARLQGGPSFESIIRDICQNLHPVSHECQEMTKRRPYYRAVVTLQSKAHLVDAFHNSSTGYRAQYLRSVRNGERANAFAALRIATHAMELIRDEGELQCPEWWISKSLLHHDAKVWIHQGTWFRQKD
jgi:hypothetical protein